MNEQVCAVIVTHNRKELLRECLKAVLSQTRPPDHVLVVDNASTDGTGEMLREEFPGVEVLRLHQNGGGAKGYKWGLEKARKGLFGWYWLMDDDTLPEKNALEALLEGRESFREIKGYEPLLLGSSCVWKDSTPHLMNWPGFIKGEKDFYKLARKGLLAASHLTFVSLLVSAKALERYGLPYEDFFLWGDDTEFVGRITLRHKEAVAALVLESQVTHASKTNRRPFEIEPPLLHLYFFEARNRVWLAKVLPDPQARLYHLAALGVNTIRFIWRNRRKIQAWWVPLQGFLFGLFTRPRK